MSIMMTMLSSGLSPDSLLQSNSTQVVSNTAASSLSSLFSFCHSGHRRFVRYHRYWL